MATSDGANQYEPAEVAAPVRIAMPDEVPILSAPARSIEIAALWKRDQ
jgi:hypothetical protein